jgi:response regulator RpfG family c-di-GMP phosphodiesterase
MEDSPGRVTAIDDYAQRDDNEWLTLACNSSPRTNKTITARYRPQRQGAHALLLEDVAIINNASADMIEEMGCRVSPFMHLAPALESTRVDPPDVAVLDVKIHDETSYQVAEELHHREIPIISD